MVSNGVFALDTVVQFDKGFDDLERKSIQRRSQLLALTGAICEIFENLRLRASSKPTRSIGKILPTSLHYPVLDDRNKMTPEPHTELLRRSGSSENRPTLPQLSKPHHFLFHFSIELHVSRFLIMRAMHSCSRCHC